MKLTKNFNLNEFAVSSSYPDLVPVVLNALNDNKSYQANLKLLCESVLQPVRDEFSHEKVTILSGLRTAELNSAVGGSSTSDHLTANAADFKTNSHALKFLWMFYNKIPYRQLILYPDQNFIHVSINIPGKPFKNEALIKYDDSSQYIPYKGGAVPNNGVEIRPGDDMSQAFFIKPASDLTLEASTLRQTDISTLKDNTPTKDKVRAVIIEANQNKI
jgi:hypothetical protein